MCNAILSIGMYEYLEYMMAISGLGRLGEVGEGQSITRELDGIGEFHCQQDNGGVEVGDLV